MKLDMTDGQFVALLDWSHPAMATVTRTGRDCVDALAAAAAIRTQTPRTITVPGRLAAITTIWQRDYADHVEQCRASLEAWASTGHDCSQEAATRYLDLVVGDYENRRLERQHLVPLAARMFALTADPRYVAMIDTLVSQWISHAPPCPDGDAPAYAGWLDGYTGMDVLLAAHVSEHWLMALPIVQPHLTDERFLAMLKALAAMADFQYRCWRTRFYFNFTVFGVKACAATGLAFPQFADADRWLGLGCERFFGDLCRPPIHQPDGFVREGLGYQNVNGCLHLQWYLLCRAHAIEVPDHYRQGLEKMLAINAAVIRPDGSLPQQGETRANQVYKIHSSARAILQAAAAVFDRPDLRTAAAAICGDRLDPEWLWMVEPATYKRWQAMPYDRVADRTLPSAHLNHAKYATLRHGSGLDALSALLVNTDTINHGHHDALHLDVYGLGRALLTDTGYAGPGDEETRRFDWHVSRHNTMAIDNLDSPGPNRWPREMTRQVAWQDDERITAAASQHELFVGYRLRRVVALLKPIGGFVVWDIVWPTTQVHDDVCVRTWFHFHAPETDVVLGEDGRCWSAYVPGKHVRVFERADATSPCRGTFDWPEVCRAQAWSDSDANVLVAPAVPERSIVDRESSWLYLNPGAVQRPAVRYQTVGAPPMWQAYLVLPFRGLTPPAATVTADDDGRATVSVASRSVTLDISALITQNVEANAAASLTACLGP